MSTHENPVIQSLLDNIDRVFDHPGWQGPILRHEIGDVFEAAREFRPAVGEANI